MSNPKTRLKDIFSRCEKVGKCLEWQGARDRQGYARIHYKNRLWNGNRLVYYLTNGDIPPGLYVMHKCDNPKCVRLSHLRLGTAQDNIDDMIRKGRKVSAARRTHCSEGHLLAGENLKVIFMSKTYHRRVCVTCYRAKQRQYWHKKQPDGEKE